MSRFLIAPMILIASLVQAETPLPKEQIESAVAKEQASLEQLYKSFHGAPELSLMERETAKRYAEELRKSGYTVTEGVGGNGVVGVLRNGTGKTLLIRADMDALPVREETGAAYASKVEMKDRA